jgi:hypothetical protein
MELWTLIYDFFFGNERGNQGVVIWTQMVFFFCLKISGDSK